MSDSQAQEPELDWRRWTMDHAKLVRAFEPATFADGAEDTPLLAAGALIMAATQIIDELFQDIETLATDGGSVADSEGAYFVLEDLPQLFAHQYNGRFARNFHVATVMVTGRLSAEQWTPPASVGEALALHLVIQRAQHLLVDHELLDRDEARELYLGFEDAAFEDIDHEWLYRADMDGFENDKEFAARFGATDMRVQSWFQPTGNGPAHVHAFSIELETPKQA
ncbi:hypothetical protein [Jidongwangia harbinensis]|uniref:hypothetical protein n=1 Tax=Jidongwangia harbinensis TaxID=2878561 RepID=UPI001CD9B8EB|nr:hypothetical protein [Jidongwangia harbinensis]MCA2218050.1 hypothetical protein [Jidongwangia harbinensis]